MMRSSGSLGLAALSAFSMLLLGHVSVEGEQAKKAPARKGAAKAAAPPLTVDISVAGLQIVGAPVGPSEYGEVTAFSSSPGIQIALAVRVPEAYTIIDADEDKSTVVKLVDDQGTDLAIEPEFDFSPTVTTDRRALMTTLRTKGTPAPTARAFTAQGELSVTTARGDSTARAAKVALVKGTAFKAGGTAYTVDEIEAADENTYVTVGMTREALERVKEMRFLDASGQPIEASQTMRGYSMDTGAMAYSVKGSPKVATIEVVRYENLQTQHVPFTFTVGLGSAR